MTTQAENLKKYTNDWIDTFLTNYEVLIGDAAELATEWTKIDQEEQTHHRSISMQTWGTRRTLGELYEAGRLTSEQVSRLAELDQALLEAAPQVEVCYGPSLPMLIKNLLDWGTPLAKGEGTIRLEVPRGILPALAQALAEVI